MGKAINPAGQGDKQQIEGLYDVGHCTNGLSVIFPGSNMVRFARILVPYGQLTPASFSRLPGKHGSKLSLDHHTGEGRLFSLHDSVANRVLEVP